MALRLGEILMRKGVMTPGQVEAVLEAQKRLKRPFGELAEEMFGVHNEHLEEAWADQYESLTARVDPIVERSDPATRAMVTTRQAWQFRVVPLRMDGSELMVCTSREHLPRALRFCYRHFGPQCYFVLCSAAQLIEALVKFYPMPGAELVLDSVHATRAAAG
jgi:hypothetical protein